MTDAGLDPECFAHIDDISEDLLKQETIKYFIAIFVESRALGLQKENDSDNEEPLEKQLISVGFMPEVAKSFAMNIPEDVIKEQSTSDWAIMLLSIKFDVLSLTRSFSFPYQAKITNTFFETSLPSENADILSGDRKYPIMVINVTNKDATKTIIQSKLTEFRQDGGMDLFYHGTHDRHAQSILENGISLNESKNPYDFSNGSAFHLYSDFKKARDWANVKKSPGSLGAAVLVYAIEREILREAQENKGLDLINTDIETKKKWREVVRYYRQGGTDQQIERKYNLNGKHFIIGPVCKNGGEAHKRNIQPQSYSDHVLQMCIKNESFAERFVNLSNLKCVVFYKA